MKNTFYKINYRRIGLMIKNVFLQFGIFILFISIFTVCYGNDENYELSLVKNNGDSVKIRVPIDTNIVETEKKIFIFIEYKDGLAIDRIDLKTGEKKRILDLDGNEYEQKIDSQKFRGHWSGFEIGINELGTNGFSVKPIAGYEFMDMKTFSSWNVNINFSQSSLPVKRDKLGIVTGLGLELNSYRFQNNNSIQKNDFTGIIEERVLINEYEVKKSKLKASYLTLPVLLEAQFRKKNSKELSYVSAGVIGGLNIGSSIKVKHETNDVKQKLIEKGESLNFNKWKLGLTFRIGHRDKNNSSSGFYATYYLTPLFEKNLGPELHPFEIGFRLDI